VTILLSNKEDSAHSFNMEDDGQSRKIIMEEDDAQRILNDKINKKIDGELWEVQSALASKKNLHLEMAPIPTKPETTTTAKGPPKKQYKWAVDNVDSGYKLDRTTAVPLANLLNINWEEGIKGSERSESGSSGVFFVEMKSGGVFAVKPAKGIAEEIFTNLLALRLGIYVPKLRVLHADGIEGIQLFNQIINTDKLGASIFGLSGAPYFLVKEFIPAKNIDKFVYSDMQVIFGTETELSANSLKRINELAIILVLDVLTNFGDRLPFIWPNQGNSGNLMLTETGQFICVENGFNDIKDSVQFEKYKKTVGDLLKKVVENQDKHIIPEFQHIDQKLFSYTDYSFQSGGVIALQLAFRNIVKNSVDMEIYSEMKIWKEVLSRFTTALPGLEGINLDFINQIWEIFRHYGRLC